MDYKEMISNRLGGQSFYKNGYYKFFKNLLNYGTKWHDFNFAPIYNKMEKFNDPNNKYSLTIKK